MMDIFERLKQAMSDIDKHKNPLSEMPQYNADLNRLELTVSEYSELVRQTKASGWHVDSHLRLDALDGQPFNSIFGIPIAIKELSFNGAAVVHINNLA